MSGYEPVGGSNRELLPGSRPAGPADAAQIASVTVRLRSKVDPASLVAKAYALGSTPLKDRQYLTHAELESQHGANPGDLDAIEHSAQAHNLTVVHRSAAERIAVLKGRLGDPLNAFHADVQMYHHASGTYRGRRGEIQVPLELAPLITGIFGFDTRPKDRSPHSVRHWDARDLSKDESLT